MRKKNLIFPLVVSSLLIPSIEAIERTTDINSLDHENIYEAVDILIAEGGGGGMTMQEKKKRKERQKKAQENAKIRIKTNLKNSDDTHDDPIYGSTFDKYKNPDLTITLKLINNIAKEYLIKGLKEDINNLPEIFYEDEIAPKNIPLFNRSLAFTEKAFEAQENGKTEKAKILSELAIKSTIREEKIINKKSIKKQLEEKLSDTKIVDSIKFTLFGLNSLILEDYEEGNRNFKKALNNKDQDTANLKRLVAFTEIASGNINQGCSDIEELILDGTIDIDDVDDFLLEEMCRSPF